MQILNKYKKSNPILQLDRSNIIDFTISHTKMCDSNINTLPIFNMDFSTFETNNIISSREENIWDDATISSEILSNIGFTGIDNGLIHINNDYLNNDEFLSILKNSTYSLNSKKLKLSPIISNTGVYSTDYQFINVDYPYFKFNGGGLQGFFKTSNENYQVLPSTIDDAWTLYFKLRPMDYDEKLNSFNSLHPNNKGFFFYIGTRAENKFLLDYNYDFSNYKIRTNINYDSCKSFDEDYYIDDYIMREETLKNYMLSLNNGVSINTEGYFEIETDNKYLFFDKTKDGFNTETWDESVKFILTGITRPNINLYLLLNKTKTGYTVDNIDEYIDNYKTKTIEQVIKNDIINNAFGLKINDNGSIGYRYIIESCSNELGYEIIEEYSHENIINHNEWNNIFVKLKKVSSNKMKIYIYVNSYLKFVSRELPLLNLRKLDEIDSKQEGVPYNISIGCGTMGLVDSISWDYNKPFKYILPIEENFCGTFIGDIADFKFFMNDINVKDNNL